MYIYSLYTYTIAYYSLPTGATKFINS